MPLTTRVKRAFTRSSNSSTDSTPSTTTPSSNTDLTATTTLSPTPTSATLNKTSTINSTKSSKAKKFRLFRRTPSEWDDWPEHLYKPHEVPPPKYKRVPAKEHTDLLEAYSFASAFDNTRRRSATSLYSPMGSRMPSRYNSVSSRAGVSGPGRSQSIATESVPGHDHDDGTAESNSGNNRPASGNKILSLDQSSMNGLVFAKREPDASIAGSMLQERPGSSSLRVGIAV